MEYGEKQLDVSHHWHLEAVLEEQFVLVAILVAEMNVEMINASCSSACTD